MNISSFMPLFNRDDEAGLSDLDRAAKQGPKNGPVKLRFISAGQQRRAEARYRKAQSRKATKRHRREFHQTGMAIAVLRGMLQTVASEPIHTGGYRVGQDPEAMRVAHEYLTEEYGSVDAAQAAYDKLVGRVAA